MISRLQKNMPQRLHFQKVSFFRGANLQVILKTNNKPLCYYNCNNCCYLMNNKVKKQMILIKKILIQKN